MKTNSPRVITAFNASDTHCSQKQTVLLYADVIRLLYRHLTKLYRTGIDRVNLEYAHWAVEHEWACGKLRAQRGTRV